MIPILTQSEIKDVERRSSEEHGLTELDMIMSAGEAVFQSIKEILEEGPDFGEDFEEEFEDGPEPPSLRRPGNDNGPEGVIAFVCGKGHNGADALSAALLTAQAGFGVVIYQIDAETYSEETRRLHEQLAAADLRVHTIASPVDLPVFTEVDLIVDGLLGSGVKGPPEGLIQSCIFGMNRSGLPILSIDAPSGIASDDSRVPGTAVKASTTLCLGAMKLSAAFHPSLAHYGKVAFSPICFDEKLLFQQPSRMEMYTEEDATDFLPVKTYRTHKYTAGKVLVIAGSRGMHGAPSLAANAALRSGAGLVRVAMPAGVYAQAVPHLLEIIGVPVGDDQAQSFTPADVETLLPELEWADAVVVGPGIGRGETARAFLHGLLPHLAGRKAVWDGDALEILAEAALPAAPALDGWVATPHAGEYRKMGGDYDYEAPLRLLESLRAFTRGKGYSTLLKGPTTAFSHPDGRLLVVPAGNPGMATAGSGDVLAGILGAFLAVRPVEIAAPMAAYLHGRAGDAARRDRGTLGMAASDLILYLPLALKDLEDLAAESSLEAEQEG